MLTGSDQNEGNNEKKLTVVYSEKVNRENLLTTIEKKWRRIKKCKRSFTQKVLAGRF